MLYLCYCNKLTKQDLRGNMQEQIQYAYKPGFR